MQNLVAVKGANKLLIDIRHMSVATSDRPAVFMPFPADVNVLYWKAAFKEWNSERCLVDTQWKLMSGNSCQNLGKKNIKIHHNVRLHNVKQLYSCAYCEVKEKWKKVRKWKKVIKKQSRI